MNQNTVIEFFGWWLLFASCWTFGMFGLDKRRAKRNSAHRISQFSLLLASAVGGWPGGLLGIVLPAQIDQAVVFAAIPGGLYRLRFAGRRGVKIVGQAMNGIELGREPGQVASMIQQKSKDPLHGITLERLLTELVAEYGWEEMSRRIEIRCFLFDPSMKSSLTFLRKTPWARTKIEEMYVRWKTAGGAAQDDA